MMKADDNVSENEVANEALFALLVTSFKRLFIAYKQQWLTSKNLLAADVKLTLKALMICVISLLLITGIILTSWITINIAIVYWFYSLGLYWLASVAVFLLFNALATFALKRSYNHAKNSLNINTSLAVLFRQPDNIKE